ncbi:SPOR domain-containing protein [Streptomyces sp. NPDC059649]|uniref:SPOR domain-containing protein n=1 Tax=Streptomyces sp. NPDC059649 TaxID=3346895 RepID=UPI0036C91413
MTENGAVLPWLVIRQDEGGNRYRVGRYATRAEAERVAERLDTRGNQRLYVVEKVNRATT